MTVLEKTLEGLRVLVPRGGVWGTLVAEALRAKGATPKIAPLIDFSHTSDEEKLRESLQKLEAGYFDWITATNATVVEVLHHHKAVIPPRTKLAIAGEATNAAFTRAGYEVARTTAASDPTVQGLLDVWPEIDAEESVLKVLTLRSDVAKPVLTEGLLSRGHNVTQVIAYRTVGVPASVMVREDVESGHINVLLVTSPQVAREVFVQFRSIPKSTLIVCVGEGATAEGERLGLLSCELTPGARILTQRITDTVMDVIDPADLVD